MTATATAAAPTIPANPHRIPAAITGWAIPFVVLGALWGAGHQPEDASWSAAAVVAIVAIFALHKTRQAVWNLRHRGAK